MRSINPLPGAVRSSVRSGVILFDLPRIVEELVFNSLDAGATKVSVYVGIGTCSVKVVDDGSGIPRDGLVLLGERYATSKFHQLADMDDASGSFGFRGEALASISDVSVLEIVTKAFGRPNGYRKVIKGCKCIYLGIDSDRKEAGTTVNVRDLFYNQPVRRKYMQSSPKRVLHSVKKCVLMIALVHSQISFKVIDNESGDELLCTHPSSPLSLLKSEFGVEVPDSLHELNVSDDILKLSGYVSGPCDGSEIKAFQYVYINSRFICKGPIHKLLNQLAIQFDCLDPWKINSQKQKRSRSQPYPAYILNLSCPRSLYDLTFEPSKAKVEFKNWAPILTFTEKAIQRFWNDNLTLRIDLSETSEIAKKKGRVKNHKASLDIFSSPSEMLKEFDHLSDIEHDGIPCTNLHKNSAAFKEQQNEMGFVCQNDYAFQSWDGLETKCIPSATYDTGWLNLESEAKDYTRVDKYESQRDTMGYQDSEQDCVPKKRSRRGLSAPPFYRGKRRFFSLNCPSIMNAGKPGAKIFHNALSYPEDDMPKHAKQPSGAHHLYFKPSSMEHLLSDNRLDVEKMTSISANLKEKEEGDTVEQSCYFGSQDMAPVFFSKKTQDSVNSWSKWRSFSSKITNKNKSCDTNNESHILDISSGFLHLAGDSLVPESINKNCLGNAKVLQQVDKKFIPVVAGGTLAVIDQHAADERIRLEELRKKVFSGEAKTINYLKIEQELILPEIAYQLLQNYAEQIKDWGWICNIHGQDSRSFKWNLNLLHRRPIVVTLLAVPNILGVNLSDVDLLEFLQQLADTDGSSTMPPSVLRVLNMKACRGAIMFGDSLLPSECSLIVEELTQTSLCFQCAHGRPTTIPIVNLEALHKQTAKLGSLGDNPNKLWHGLHRQELSIDRAAQRLGSARA
ncbi:hypothetical protein CIPAW_07G002300 [Carya illinoinensis]|uniref:DNA mismatch repair protein MLH3 n=1 Tax=Carya illinoinensis TaxID=32201 RepID=A0A8T1PY35_CARIL|nr:hypothetical protein CIPAW_07G002300 [Carya illinoinensis]